MKSLTDIANSLCNDKGTKNCPNPLHFTTIYEKYLQDKRDEPLNFLEIGVGSGTSVLLWQEFFPNAKINVMDITFDSAVYSSKFDRTRVNLLQGDQTNRDHLSKVAELAGPFDFIIDDGGHMMGMQQISLGTLFSSLKKDGLYFIEDLHTSFWPHNGYEDLYGTKLDINEDRSNTTVNVIEDYIKTKEMSSPFLSDEENQALTNSITSGELFDLPESEYGPNKLALFKN